MMKRSDGEAGWKMRPEEGAEWIERTEMAIEAGWMKRLR